MDSKCIETVTQSRIDDIETPSMLSDWMHSQFYRVAIFKQLEGVGSMGSKKSELEPKKRNTVSFLVDAKDKKEVKKLHFQNIKYVSKSFENSVMIGEILDRIKKNSPHGKFTDIVKKDFSYMSIRSAQYYMKIFHNQDGLRKEMGENLSMREAIKYLSKPMDDTSE